MRSPLRMLTGTFLLSVAVPGFSQPGEAYMHDHMWNSGGWFMGPIFMLLLLAAIVALVVFLLKQTGGSMHSTQSKPMHQKDTPLEILKIRYAKGEIDHEEFEQRQKTLES